MTDPQHKAKAIAFVDHAVERIGWMFENDYPRPSEEIMPFVCALMARAVDQNDDDAVDALKKLFPPKAQA